MLFALIGWMVILPPRAIYAGSLVVLVTVSFFLIGFMDNSSRKRKMGVLCWNIRGLNSEDKWKAIRSKVTECDCDIICLQETKREFF